MNATLPLVAGLAAGVVHAMEADHMVAVTTFVAKRPRPLQALRFGIRWGVGHSLVIATVGTALVLLDVRLPPALIGILELSVGVMMLGLGLWLLTGLLRHGRALDYGCARPVARPSSGSGGHRATWVGVVHGLGGTAALLALLPVTLLGSPGLAGAYLLMFGLGTILSMGLYSFIAGWLFLRAGRHSSALAQALRGGTAVASMGIGAFWLYTAAAG